MIKQFNLTRGGGPGDGKSRSPATFLISDLRWCWNPWFRCLGFIPFIHKIQYQLVGTFSTTYHLIVYRLSLRTATTSCFCPFERLSPSIVKVDNLVGVVVQKQNDPPAPSHFKKWTQVVIGTLVSSKKSYVSIKAIPPAKWSNNKKPALRGKLVVHSLES